MPPHQYFYRDTISRRIANQGERGSISPWDETMPRWTSTQYFLVSGKCYPWLVLNHTFLKFGLQSSRITGACYYTQLNAIWLLAFTVTISIIFMSNFLFTLFWRLHHRLRQISIGWNIYTSLVHFHTILQLWCHKCRKYTSSHISKVYKGANQSDVKKSTCFFKCFVFLGIKKSASL